MGHRSLMLAVAAIASICATGANAQSVYVAPGGVYIGGGPVYVTPAPTPYAAPTYGPAPYAAPTYGYGHGYGPPAVAVPAPAIVAPTSVYQAPVYAYGAELAPRPPAPVPYVGVGRCAYGYSPYC